MQWPKQLHYHCSQQTLGSSQEQLLVGTHTETRAMPKNLMMKMILKSKFEINHLNYYHKK